MPADDGIGTHVFLVGEMGVGKTTVGTLLAARLGRPFHDSDRWIEGKLGRDGAAIALSEGVDRLHQLELRTLEEMSAQPTPAVIAPAASVIDAEEGRDGLASGATVWLVAPAEVTAARVGSSGHRRRYEEGERTALWKRRRPHLERIATMVVDTGRGTPDQVVDEILHRLGETGT